MKVQQRKNTGSSNSAHLSKSDHHSQLKHLYLVAFLLFGLYMTYFRNAFFLKWAEAHSLFVSSGAFFQECMRYAGGLLNYGGAFLTQFYHFPLLGSLIFIALLVFIKQLLVAAFEIPEKWDVLAYVPPLLLLLSVTQLGYVWLTLKSPGYLFSNSLGVLVVLLVFFCYRQLKTLGWRLFFIVLLNLVAYPLFGFYALLSVALLVSYELRLFFGDRRYRHLFPVFSGIILALVLPQLYYNYVYSYMQYIHVYISVLPRFAFTWKEMVLWAPFLLLFVSLFLLAVFVGKPKHLYQANKYPKIPLFVLASSLTVVYFFSYSDTNFEAEVKMEGAMAQSKFRAVVHYAERVAGVPTRNILLNNNFARMALGQPESRRLTLNNSIEPRSPRSSVTINIYMSGRPLFYFTGYINECYRWSMEYMVEYGKRVSNLKYMVKCAIVNQEYALAQKYNSLLSQTLFHKDWARRYQAFIDQPELTENDNEIQAIRRLMVQEGAKDN